MYVLDCQVTINGRINGIIAVFSYSHVGFTNDDRHAYRSDVRLPSCPNASRPSSPSRSFRKHSLVDYDISGYEVCGDRNEARNLTCRGKYGQSSISFFTTLRWKVYLWLLQFRLWLNDLYIEWVFRRMMQKGYEMELDPDVVFKKLIKEDE